MEPARPEQNQIARTQVVRETALLTFPAVRQVERGSSRQTVLEGCAQRKAGTVDAFLSAAARAVTHAFPVSILIHNHAT